MDRASERPLPMRLMLLSAPLATLLSCLYVASPFISVWMLREAIRQGDTVTLERKVHWPSVRESVKASLAEPPRRDSAGVEIKPSLWRRATGAVKSAALDRFVDRYVTPEGLPRLFGYRESARTAAAMATASAAPAPASAPWQQRLADLYARVKRAEFQTPTRVEIEIADRSVADRRYVSVLELVGLEWKLTGLRIISAAAGVE